MTMPAPRALIFDLDHTLADTTRVWQQAQDTLAAYLGCTWNDELETLAHGLNASDLAAAVHAHVRSARTLQESQACMRNALITAYAGAPIHEMPGAVALVRRLHGHAVLAVASGSPQEGIMHALRQLGIAALFDCVLSSESVARGKPHPDVFLAAAQALQVAPAACLVFEDSPAGMRAARAAGMRCFAVPHGNQDGADQLATRVFSSWHAVQHEDVFGVA